MLKTPIKLVDSSSLNRLSNSVNIASDMRIAVNDGYILKVKQQGVEVSGGNDPYDTEAYMKAQKMAGSLSTLLRNACGNMHTVAYSQEEYVVDISMELNEIKAVMTLAAEHGISINAESRGYEPALISYE